jgi:hypothetical protein
MYFVQALSEQITKRSATLNRDAVFKKTTVLTRLPPWLTIHFVRFYYKAQQRERAKILRVRAPLAQFHDQFRSPRSLLIVFFISCSACPIFSHP